MDVGGAAVAEAELVEPELVPRHRVLRLDVRRATVGGQSGLLVAGILLGAGEREQRLERERVE